MDKSIVLGADHEDDLPLSRDDEMRLEGRQRGRDLLPNECPVCESPLHVVLFPLEVSVALIDQCQCNHEWCNLDISNFD